MLGEILKRKIEEKGNGFKRSTLAKKAGVSEELIHRIIYGKTPNPGIHTIVRLADVLECSVDELVERNNFVLPKNSMLEDKILPYNLVLESLEFIFQYLKKEGKPSYIHLVVLSYLIKSICNHSIKNNMGTINKEFALDLCEDTFL